MWALKKIVIRPREYNAPEHPSPFLISGRTAASWLAQLQRLLTESGAIFADVRLISGRLHRITNAACRIETRLAAKVKNGARHLPK